MSLLLVKYVRDIKKTMAPNKVLAKPTSTLSGRLGQSDCKSTVLYSSGRHGNVASHGRPLVLSRLWKSKQALSARPRIACPCKETLQLESSSRILVNNCHQDLLVNQTSPVQDAFVSFSGFRFIVISCYIMLYPRLAQTVMGPPSRGRTLI